VLYGMVPIVVSLYVKSHRVWWITSTLSLLTIIGIGSSRVYLGVTGRPTCWADSSPPACCSRASNWPITAPT